MRRSITLLGGYAGTHFREYLRLGRTGRAHEKHYLAAAGIEMATAM